MLCDIRDEEQVGEAVRQTVETFGGIDICINNASAIQLSGTLATDMKRFDLMHQINTRGTFLVSRTCLPHLLKSDNAHILNLSPPLDMNPKWFARHIAYTMAKYGMSMCVLGMAEEFRDAGIAVNALWPLTAIDTAAVRNVLGGDAMAKMSRLPGDHGRRGPCRPVARPARLHRQFLHRRGSAARRGRDRLLEVPAS